jgi:hypothetical protein
MFHSFYLFIHITTIHSNKQAKLISNLHFRFKWICEVHKAGVKDTKIEFKYYSNGLSKQVFHLLELTI